MRAVAYYGLHPVAHVIASFVANVTMVSVGVDLGDVRTTATLQQALEVAFGAAEA